MNSVGEKRLQRTVTLVCATMFVAFSFTFIALYKAPLLEALYDKIATGRLDFNPYVVAAFVSAALTLFAFWLNSFLKFKREWTALVYLPSCTLLAFITDINRTIYTGEGDMLPWLFIFLSVILFNLFVSFILRRVLFAKIKNYNVEGNRIIWRNNMLFVVMFLATGFFSDSDKNLYNESLAYSQYKRGNIENALEVARSSLTASHELTASRAYYLALKGELAEKLFCYPQYFGAEGLLPDTLQTTPLSPDSVYHAIGVQRMQQETAMQCLQRATEVDSISGILADYYLCALLLEKRIMQFREELPHYYTTNSVDSLPAHYKEALLLYDYVTSTADEETVDSTLQNKFNSIRDLVERGNHSARKGGNTIDELENTYWWYYLYE